MNPRSFAKYPIYRLERVPEGDDVFTTVSRRVSEELGLTRLPPQQ